MLLLYVFNFVLFIISLPLTLLPTVSLLPFGLDSIVVSSSAELHAMIDEFWFMQRPLQDFIYLLSIIAILLIVKFFLGSHSPEPN